jgi:hypothetical protein
MATFTKLSLQPTAGTTGTGRLIKIAQTATAGTTIHTASNTATTIDELWLYAQNDHSSDVLLTVEWGGTSNPDDLIRQTITSRAGLLLVVPGLILQGNATPLVVRAFAATANVVMVGGYVNRITV